MLSEIHLLLAFASVMATAAVAIEAGWRAIGRARLPGLARRLATAQFVVVALTAGAGFALVAAGEAARSGLHYLLAVIALLGVPAAPMAVMRAGNRGRAAATCVAALVALVAVGLLFATG